MNHLHIANIQHFGCADISEDKLIYLGHVLREFHQVKLKAQFPDRPCTVEFYTPPKANELLEYQITFWADCPRLSVHNVVTAREAVA